MVDEVKVEQTKILLSWRAKSRPYNPADEQTKSVLTVLGILVGLVIIFSGEWMILVVMAASGFFYFVWNNTPPEEVEFSISNKGVNAFGRTYMWWELSRWWIDEKGSMKLLGLELNSGVLARIYVPIEMGKEAEVQKIMEKYVTFEKPSDTTLDTMGKWLVNKFPLSKNK